jgi:hypothetical protein
MERVDPDNILAKKYIQKHEKFTEKNMKYDKEITI